MNLNLKKGKKNGNFQINNLRIINNSSSINIIKTSGNKNVIPEINNNNVGTNNPNNNKKRKKFLSFKNKAKKENNSTEKSTKNKTKNISYLPTQVVPKNQKNKNDKSKNLNNFALINIDLNLSKNKNYIPPESNIILNNYSFEEAIKYDKRRTCEIFYIYFIYLLYQNKFFFIPFYFVLL